MGSQSSKKKDYIQIAAKAIGTVARTAVTVSCLAKSIPIMIANPIAAGVTALGWGVGWCIKKISEFIIKRKEQETEAKKEVLDACKKLGQKRQEVKRQISKIRGDIDNKGKTFETELVKLNNAENNYQKDINKALEYNRDKMREHVNRQQLLRQQKLSEWSDKIKAESGYIIGQKNIEIAKINGRKEENIETIKKDGKEIQELIQKQKNETVTLIEEQFMKTSKVMKQKLIDISNQFDDIVNNEWLKVQDEITFRILELEGRISEEEKRLEDELISQQNKILQSEEELDEIEEEQIKYEMEQQMSMECVMSMQHEEKRILNAMQQDTQKEIENNLKQVVEYTEKGLQEYEQEEQKEQEEEQKEKIKIDVEDEIEERKHQDNMQKIRDQYELRMKMMLEELEELEERQEYE